MWCLQGSIAGSLLIIPDILVIEALLKLIFKLLPSQSTGVAARNAFVRDVFDVATFPNSYYLISNILGTTPPTVNWDVVVIEIIDLLANTSLEL